MHFTIAAHVTTGDRFDRDSCMFIVWTLVLFFCVSKVMEITYAEARSGLPWKIRNEILKNLTFCSVSSFVVLVSFGLVVLLYSHDCIAKKKALMISSVHADDMSSLLFKKSWNTLLVNGTALCLVSFGSWALYASSCLFSDNAMDPQSVNPGWLGSWFVSSASSKMLGK